jgi:indole-3-glycerol phosphate synthase
LETILDRIITARRIRLEARKTEVSPAAMEALSLSLPAPKANLLQVLSQPKTKGLHVIAEVKKASPSKGIIRADFEPYAIAKAYGLGGASALSVLTEVDHFQGSDLYLTALSRESKLPCLRKDFLTEAYQVHEAKVLGASAFLLIVACLEPKTLANLIALGQKIGLTPLTEVHTSEELTIALDAGAPLIGINNRDLKTFTISLDVTLAIRPKIPPGIPVISESGVFTESHMRTLVEANVHAALIGESLMRETTLNDVTAKLRLLAEAG